ncbi:hypothetical protein SISNIDRAFT_459902 [Sistotremastrum niveocremeum HHB9708]|uniref:Uncharacterized protein n=2 Tax=Sistotremastraceae TaxID=3402574 RepID=A0A164P6T5_9AGAM|nr:hypothetical protein SISNIDRAFT_459902 [Sistotremastrum niveocremeum HHB9708]KZT31876.1 hypothetical protein SISSUDRAFT_1056179 [Sistotremastrum suecicum HHB10207 ss-3]
MDASFRKKYADRVEAHIKDWWAAIEDSDATEEDFIEALDQLIGLGAGHEIKIDDVVADEDQSKDGQEPVLSPDGESPEDSG